MEYFSYLSHESRPYILCASSISMGYLKQDVFSSNQVLSPIRAPLLMTTTYSLISILQPPKAGSLSSSPSYPRIFCGPSAIGRGGLCHEWRSSLMISPGYIGTYFSCRLFEYFPERILADDLPLIKLKQINPTHFNVSARHRCACKRPFRDSEIATDPVPVVSIMDIRNSL